MISQRFVRPSRPTVQLRLERLETRDVPAAISGSSTALTIALGTNESVTISESGGTETFALSTGTFTGSIAGVNGSGTNAITLASGGFASTSTVAVNNIGAGAGANNVTFAGGTFTQTFTVAATAAGTTSAINFTTARSTFSNTTAAGSALTSNGAGIVATAPVTFAAPLTVTANGQPISLAVPGTDLASIKSSANTTSSTNVTLSDSNSCTIVTPGLFATGTVSLVAGNFSLSNLGGAFTTSAGLGSSAEVSVGNGATLTIAGTTQMDLGSLSGGGAIDVGVGTLSVGGNNRSSTFSGVISGAMNATGSTKASLTKVGVGTFTLAGANLYPGTTSVSTGTLALGAANAILPGSELVVNGTLSLAGFSTTALALAGSGTVDLGSATLTLTNGLNTTARRYTTANTPTMSAINFSGSIVGSGSLVKDGDYRQILSGINSFTGGTTIKNGVLQYNVGIGAVAGSITVQTGGTAAAGYPIDQTFLGKFSSATTGVIALAVSSGNALDFNAANLPLASLGSTAAVTYSGSLTPFGTTFRLGGGGIGASDAANSLTISSNLTGAGNSVVVTSGGTPTISLSTIAGAPPQGTALGTVVLSGTNAYGGGTTVDSGTLTFASLAAVGGSGANVTVNFGGTVAAGFAINQLFLARVAAGSTGVVALAVSSANDLDFNLAGLASANLGASAAGVTYSGTLTPYGSTYRVGGGGSPLVISSNLNASAGLAASLNGTAYGPTILTGTNTYIGNTTVDSGILQFNSAGAIGGTDASVTISSGGTAAAGYAIDQAFLRRIAPASHGVVALAVGSSNALDFDAAGLQFASLGAAGFAAAVAAADVASDIAYSGALTPYGGVYRLGGGGGSLVVGAVLDETTQRSVQFTLNGTSGNGRVKVAAANSYTGNTTISSGLVVLTGAGALGGAINVAAGSTLAIATDAATVPNDIVLNGLGSVQSGSIKPALFVDSTSAHTLSGVITLAATADVGGNADLAISGKITGPGGLTRGAFGGDESATALVLSNPANDFAGDTTITVGMLRTDAAEVIPNGAGKGGVVVNAGATLDLRTNDETINRLTGAGTVIRSGVSPSAAVVTTDTDADTGIAVSKTYSHLLDFKASGSAAVVNSVPFVAAGLTGGNYAIATTGTSSYAADGPNDPLLLSFLFQTSGFTDPNGMINLLSDGYTFTAGDSPSSTMTLTGLTAGASYKLAIYTYFYNNGSSLPATVNFSETGSGPGTTVAIDLNDATGTGDFFGFPFSTGRAKMLTYTYTAQSDGAGGALPVVVKFTANSGSSPNLMGLSNEVLPPPPSTLTVGDSTTGSFAGSLRLGVGKLVKQGSGNLVLTGASTYSGSTMVSAGGLVVNGAIVASSVTVGAAGALKGTGTIPNSVADSGLAAPGAVSGATNTGVLHVGNLALNTSATVDVELNGATAGAVYDQIAVAGSVNLNADAGAGAALTVHLNYAPSSNQKFVIVDNDGTGDAVSGKFAGLNEGDVVNASFGGTTYHLAVSYVGGDGNDVTLAVQVSLLVSAVAPFVGPTLGGNTVVVTGDGFTGVTSVLFGGVPGTSIHVLSLTQLTVVAPAGSSTVNVQVVTDSAQSNTSSPADDYTYVAPAISSVTVNGGPIFARNGFGQAPNLAGTASVVEQLLVTFNVPVTVDADTFVVRSIASSLTVLGVASSTYDVAVTATPVQSSKVAGAYTQYVLTFVDDGGLGTNLFDLTSGLGNVYTTLKDGYYQLSTTGSKVHAGNATLADRVDPFWALYGAVSDLDVKVAGAIGGGDDAVFVDGVALSAGYSTVGSSSEQPGSSPTYLAPFDWNLDGNVDSSDLSHLYGNFGTIWRF